MSSQKIKIAKTDRKLYPVVVRDMDNIEKRVKIHYVEYSEQYGDWRPCDTEDSNPPFQWEKKEGRMSIESTPMRL